MRWLRRAAVWITRYPPCRDRWTKYEASVKHVTFTRKVRIFYQPNTVNFSLWKTSLDIENHFQTIQYSCLSARGIPVKRFQPPPQPLPTVNFDKTFSWLCRFYSRWRNFYSQWWNLQVLSCSVAAAQGKQGILVLSFPDRENTGNFVVTQGTFLKHGENIFDLMQEACFS